MSPWLRDYGPDKRDYLEVVPTYVDVVSTSIFAFFLPRCVMCVFSSMQVPALQFASVGMSLAHARLLDATNGDAFLASTLRANASAIFNDAIRFLWQDSDHGAWRCLYPEGNSTAVRSVNDYVYISQALGLLGRSNATFFALPANIVNESLSFFENELLSSGTSWVRALSLEVCNEMH